MKLKRKLKQNHNNYSTELYNPRLVSEFITTLDYYKNKNLQASLPFTEVLLGMFCPPCCVIYTLKALVTCLVWFITGLCKYIFRQLGPF